MAVPSDFSAWHTHTVAPDEPEPVFTVRELSNAGYAQYMREKRGERPPTSAYDRTVECPHCGSYSGVVRGQPFVHTCHIHGHYVRSGGEGWGKSGGYVFLKDKEDAALNAEEVPVHSPWSLPRAIGPDAYILMVGETQVLVRCPKCDEYPPRRLSEHEFSCIEHGIFRFLPQPNAPGFVFDDDKPPPRPVYEPPWLPKSSV